MCDEILKKNDQAPMTLNQHIAVWVMGLALIGLGTKLVGAPLVTFGFLFVAIIFGLIVVGSLIFKNL